MPTTWACSVPTSSTDLGACTNCTSGGVAAQLRFTEKEKCGYFQNLRVVIGGEASSRCSKKVQQKNEGAVSIAFRLHV